jgi:peptide/nickel transport system permease protein
MSVLARLLPTLYLRLAAGIVTFMFALALLGSLAAPQDPFAQHAAQAFAHSSWAHPLGTDFLGRDTLSRLIAGARPSLLSALAAVAIGLAGGALPGMASVLLGRRAEYLVMRVVDAAMTIPPTIFAIAIIAGFGNGLTPAVVAIGILLVPRFFRVMRADTLKLASAQYVEAAVLFGASKPYVLRRHVWRKAIPTLAVTSSSALGASVLGISSLAFLGLGEQPPAPSWGAMLASDLQYLYQAPWAAIWPGLAITVTVWSLNALSDAVHAPRVDAVAGADTPEPVNAKDIASSELASVPQYV